MRNCAFHSTYLEDRVGHATITPTAPCATGQDVILSVSYDYAYITPLAGIARTLSGNNLPATLHMSTTTKMRSE